ncbi:transglycosylase SLT domain-containing protein [Chromatocurvus halotolerans]|uniref:transglycosylase SLT domain-containing protein n=1 Tax=Chromatocurvus halotolerans TaxID=1132028 RepID=UPI001051B21A|nr:transglycosylase SLT domain-containing protein [Chromatocurvus halotolerans]
MLSLRAIPLIALLAAVGTLCPTAFSQPLQDSALSDYRASYGEARQAIDRGRWTDYERLRSRLDDYPLALYLDYFRLRSGSSRVTVQDARQFMDRSRDSPLANRFLAAYLSRAGRERRWQDYLAVMPESPNDIELQCYYFRAQLATGNALRAWQGATELWVHGQSRPKECDPLFKAWMDAGGLTDRHVWNRLKLAFEARQGGLMTYVGKQATASLTPWVERAESVYRRPDTVLTVTAGLPDSAYRDDIIHLGIRRLAAYSPEKALTLWQKAPLADDAGGEERVKTQKRIAFRSLLDRIEIAEPWLEENLPRWEDDQLTEMRLRWLLAEQRWDEMLQTLPALSAEALDSSLWLYWRGRALRETGDETGAQACFVAAAQQRNYYGFLAADTLGVDYELSNQAPERTSDEDRTFLRLPGVRRVNELQALSEPWLAHAEWRYALAREGSADQVRLAQWAADEGWHHLAIDAANMASANDALSLRFPEAYPEVFAAQAATVGVSTTEIMSIARRESAFFPMARSTADARGLMQLLPQTGRQVSRKIGAPPSTSLYDVDHNVRLGSAYYRELLDRFDDNRPLALAAYNAGPGRARTWRNSGDDRVPVDIWIETLPYRETRDYVKAVLAYNVVFGYLRGEMPDLLRPAERMMLY